ncbi:MAG: hypothetical protein SCH98_15505 [Deferrisomatales bacterium]|nr:hypothetical protein [Deferrisomatales bacterium]
MLCKRRTASPLAKGVRHDQEQRSLGTRKCKVCTETYKVYSKEPQLMWESPREPVPAAAAG